MRMNLMNVINFLSSSVIPLTEGDVTTNDTLKFKEAMRYEQRA